MNGRIEDVTTLHEGWLSLRMAAVRMDDGSIAQREIVDHPCGAAVLLYDPLRRTALLISELRPPVEYGGEPRMLEVVAGQARRGRPCGLRAPRGQGGSRRGDRRAGACGATVGRRPASSTERVDYFLAAYRRGDRVGDGGGLEEEQEEVRVREVPLATLWRMAQAGELRDAKTFLLLQALHLRRPDLFA
jgi:hypothetical protein